MRGGWGCVSPPKYELRVCLLHGGNFDTLPPCQKHSPCSWLPIFSPRPIAPQLRLTGGCERSLSRVPPLPSAPRSAPEVCRMRRKPWSCDHWGLCNTKKHNKKKGLRAWMKKFGFCSQTETLLRCVQIRRTFFMKLWRLILTIFFRWAQRLWDPLARLHLRIDTFVKWAADGLREEEKQHHQTHKGHWERKQALHVAEMKPSDGTFKAPLTQWSDVGTVFSSLILVNGSRVTFWQREVRGSSTSPI